MFRQIRMPASTNRLVANRPLAIVHRRHRHSHQNRERNRQSGQARQVVQHLLRARLQCNRSTNKTEHE